MRQLPLPLPLPVPLPLEIKDKAERKQKDFTIPDLCFFRYLFKHFGGFATRSLFLPQLALLATQLQSFARSLLHLMLLPNKHLRLISFTANDKCQIQVEKSSK